MLVLTANKAKMMELTKAMGYNPPRKAQFVKAFRARTWWLEWWDNNGEYSATLSTAAGRAFFGMRYREHDTDSPEQWTAKTLSMAGLRQFGLVEELVSKTRTVPQHREPDFEPEL